jgi:predicted DNA-binding transcriptional regulator YafY
VRLVADNPQDYKRLSLLQKQVTQLYKKEKDKGTPLEEVYKAFINTPIEKSYERPGSSTEIANTNAIMETDDPTLIIPYIVHAAINRKKMAIEYKSAKGDISKRLIEPHAWRNNSVVAWCHERGAWRQFKPSMILRAAVTDQDFDREDIVEIKPTDAKEMAHLMR